MRGTKGSPSLETILRIADNAGHSDVHLGVGERPRFRARGDIQTTDWPTTDDAVFQGWLREILSPQQIDSFYRNKELDSAFAFPFVRVRINLLDSLRGPAMVLRLIPQTILSMEELNLPEVLKDLAARPKGLVLVTGPTGSGKSTTLAAMIDWINRNKTCHILTIEDPVEFVHESRKSLIRHREVGLNTLKFHQALRAALREDPDVILMGKSEIRRPSQQRLKQLKPVTWCSERCTPIRRSKPWSGCSECMHLTNNPASADHSLNPY